MAGTILENYFGRQSPTHESELPEQFGYKGSCEPSGWLQMHTLVGSIGEAQERITF